MQSPPARTEDQPTKVGFAKVVVTSVAPSPTPKKRVFTCDQCGCEMGETNCKVVCQNCGNRFDCSDLNIYFD